MTEMPFPDLPTYARDIVERLELRKGASHVVSSRDWQLVVEWHARRIPFVIVGEAIDDCFASLARRQPVDRSRIGLRYIAPCVEELWEQRKDLYVG